MPRKGDHTMSWGASRQQGRLAKRICWQESLRGGWETAQIYVYIYTYTSWGASRQQGWLAKQVCRQQSLRVGWDTTQILLLPTGRALSQCTCPTDNHFVYTCTHARTHIHILLNGIELQNNILRAVSSRYARWRRGTHQLIVSVYDCLFYSQCSET